MPFDIATTRGQLPGLHKLTRFLVDNGSRPNNAFSQGALRGLLRFTRFQDEEYALASYLVDHGGPCTLDNGTLNHIERYNIKYILSRDKESMYQYLLSSLSLKWKLTLSTVLIVPEVARIIFQESENELKIGLESGHIGANDKACGSSLLQLAFGWPKGIQLLLEAESVVGQVPLINFWGCATPLSEEDIEFDAFLHSTRTLLEGGCQLKITDVQIAKSPTLLSLFANELAKRRWKLWKLGQSCLPQSELPRLDFPQTTVPDIYASQICAALAARGKTVDPSILVNSQYSSVYHHFTLYPRVMEELLKIGFKHIDSPGSAGVTPIMRLYEGFSEQWNIIARISWFVSKGADVSRKLPLSNAKAAHLIAVKVTRALLAELTLRKTEDIYTRWSRWEKEISQHRDKLFHPDIVDSCTCACCPRGCTPVSVALRQALRWDRWFSIPERSLWLRRLLHSLKEWNQHSEQSDQNDRSIIRLLTFDGLGLKHTCCIEIETKDRETNEMRCRDEEEITEIRQENGSVIETLEILVSEFEAKFVELGLPLIEFLEGYWHTRMIEHLLERDPYNEEHDRGARSIGVILQAEESELDRVPLLIGAQVKELDVKG